MLQQRGKAKTRSDPSGRNNLLFGPHTSHCARLHSDHISRSPRRIPIIDGIGVGASVASKPGRTAIQSRGGHAATVTGHGISGTASCNSVGGRESTWTASTDTGGTFARDPSQPTITTVVGCNDVVATQIAKRFWTLMTNARGWSINRGDLFIRFNDGTMAVLKALGPIARTPTNCRAADPNNFDCPDPVNPREAKR